jgi:hypothetical protein
MSYEEDDLENMVILMLGVISDVNKTFELLSIARLTAVEHRMKCRMNVDSLYVIEK